MALIGWQKGCNGFISYKTIILYPPKTIREKREVKLPWSAAETVVMSYVRLVIFPSNTHGQKSTTELLSMQLIWTHGCNFYSQRPKCYHCNWYGKHGMPKLPLKENIFPSKLLMWLPLQKAQCPEVCDESRKAVGRRNVDWLLSEFGTFCNAWGSAGRFYENETWRWEF